MSRFMPPISTDGHRSSDARGVIASQPRDQGARWPGCCSGPCRTSADLLPEAHDPSHAATASGATGSAHMPQRLSHPRIRPRVLASYTQKRAEVTLADIGFVQQRELFERRRNGWARRRPWSTPPISWPIPPARSSACATRSASLSRAAMLRWPPGRRATDGVWAPAWYQSVEKSTGFEAAPKERDAAELPPHLRALAEQAWPHYAALEVHRL